jgi:hypothetical protein
MPLLLVTAGGGDGCFSSDIPQTHALTFHTKVFHVITALVECIKLIKLRGGP